MAALARPLDSVSCFSLFTMSIFCATAAPPERKGKRPSDWTAKRDERALRSNRHPANQLSGQIRNPVGVCPGGCVPRWVCARPPAAPPGARTDKTRKNPTTATNDESHQ